MTITSCKKCKYAIKEALSKRTAVYCKKLKVSLRASSLCGKYEKKTA